MSTISNSRRLRRSIEESLPELLAATGAVMAHPQFRELYPELLITVHQMVRATVPLMRAALQRSREIEDTDAVAAAMVPYLARHIKEEMHHDDWLLEDLEFLGVARADVLRRMPPPSVASFIGAHYYWIHHHHPVAKLGQIAVMEGYPPTVGIIDSLAGRTGFGRPAFRTLEKHCHLDSHHRDEFDEALDAMPLGEEHHAILELSARHTVRAAAAAYREVQERAAASPDEVRVPARRPDLVVTRAGEIGRYRLDDTRLGASYEVGVREHFLLTRCDGRRTPDEVCRAFGDHFGEPLTRPELDEFLQMARSERLLAEEEAPAAG
jgi:hypothetical protein